MEDRDFSWVCAALSAVEARVSVPETVFFSKGEVALWVQTQQGQVKRRAFNDSSQPTVSQVFQYFDTLHSQELPASPTICLVRAKGTRIALTLDRLDEAKSQHGAFSRCVYVQQPLFDSPASLIHVIRLELSEGKYRSSFFTRRIDTKDCTDQRLFAKLMAFVRIIVKTLEECKRRRVVQVEFEFFVHANGEIWLIGCPGCKLSPSQFTRNTRITRKNEKTDLQTDRYSSNPPDSTLLKVQPRICTPQQFLSQMTAPANSLPFISATSAESRPVSKPALNPRTNSQTSVGLPSSRNTKRNNMSVFNANFIEMIAKGYAKSKNLMSDDFEAIFRDMDTQFLSVDESGIKARKRSSRRHDSELSDFFEQNLGFSDQLRELRTEPSPEVQFAHTSHPPYRSSPLQTTKSQRRMRDKPFRIRIYEPLLHRKAKSLIPLTPHQYYFTVVKP